MKIPNNRLRDFKWLLIYVNVARVKYYYGTIETFETEMQFLSGWDRQSKNNKSMLARNYAVRRNRMNECLGIPSKLVKGVLGTYRDDDGKVKHYKVSDALHQLGKLISTTVSHGSKAKWESNEKECTWNRKYFLNANYWKWLMTNPNAANFWSLDTMHCPKRVKKLIFKYYSKDKETEDKEQNMIVDDGKYRMEIPDEEIVWPDKPKTTVKTRTSKLTKCSPAAQSINAKLETKTDERLANFQRFADLCNKIWAIKLPKDHARYLELVKQSYDFSQQLAGVELCDEFEEMDRKYNYSKAQNSENWSKIVKKVERIREFAGWTKDGSAIEEICNHLEI